MSIFDARHQVRAHRIMQRALASARLPHAYIFHGPDGVGKELFALRLSKLLLCEKPAEAARPISLEFGDWSHPTRDACGVCKSCHLVDVGNHPDLHLIYRQLNAHHPDQTVRNRKAVDIGVDVIRHFVIDAVGVTPAVGRAKVFIVREADRITAAAQNALLKTLEEPPPTTFIILLTQSLDRLLKTTRSRCQLLEFSPLPPDFVAEKARSLADNLSEEQARLYAGLAQGSLGKALEYAADDVAALNNELTEALAELNTMSAAAVAKRILEIAKESGSRYRERDRVLSDTAAQRQALRMIFTLVGAWYGDLLRVLTGSDIAITNAGAGRRLRSAAQSADTESVCRAIDLIASAERQLDRNVNVQLCIESLLFKLVAVTARQPHPA